MNNAKEIADHFINRAKLLNEFTITTDVPASFKFNGLIPFDLKITEDQLEAKVWAVDFEEAVQRLNDFLESCQ